MKKLVRVIKVPECGYVVVGQGTYQLGQIVDVSTVAPEEIDDLLQEEMIAPYPEPQSAPSPKG
jgi:hypothetical protein